MHIDRSFTALSLLAVFAASSGLNCLAIDSVAEAYAAQAARCYSRGEVLHAAELYEKAINEEVDDANDELYRARLHNSLGECYLRLYVITKRSGDSKLAADYLDKAEKEIKEALRIKETRGNDQTDFLYIAVSLEDLGLVLSEADRVVEAEALYRKALEIRESKEGKDSKNTAVDYFGLGDVLAHQPNLFKESESNYMTALRIFRSSGSTLMAAKTHERLALLYAARPGKMAAAGKQYDAALAIYVRQLPRSEKRLREMKQRLRDIPPLALSDAVANLEAFYRKAAKPRAVHIALFDEAIRSARRNGSKADEQFFISRRKALTVSR